MLESILAKLNPDESVWIKRELSKDPYRREEMVSLLLNVGNTGFGHKCSKQTAASSHSVLAIVGLATPWAT